MSRIQQWATIAVVANICQDAELDFRQFIEAGRRYRVVRTGYAPAFNTLDGVAMVSESTTYPPSGGGDWRALYRLGWMGSSTESLIVPWYYPVERNNLLPSNWDGLLQILCGASDQIPWGITGSLAPVIFVDIQAVRTREIEEEPGGGC